MTSLTGIYIDYNKSDESNLQRNRPSIGRVATPWPRRAINTISDKGHSENNEPVDPIYDQKNRFEEIETLDNTTDCFDKTMSRVLKNGQTN